MSETKRPHITVGVRTYVAEAAAAAFWAALDESECVYAADGLVDGEIPPDVFRAVADAVIVALGLRRDSRPNDYDHRSYPRGDRYITGWIPNEIRELRPAEKPGLTGDGA